MAMDSDQTNDDIHPDILMPGKATPVTDLKGTIAASAALE
jgi:hypothetical protein